MSQLEKLGVDVGRVLGDGPPEEMLRAQRAQVLRSLAAAPAPAGAVPSRGPWLRWLWLPALGAAAIVAVVVTSRLVGPAGTTVAHAPPVTGVPAAPPIEDRWLDATLGADLSVPLADGSEVRVGRGAKGRLQRFSPRRVRVTVESGRMDLTVRPGVGNEWSVHAGAYRVNVIGTEFFVNYRPDADSVEVGVVRGRVSVSGGHLGDETVTLGPGNRLRAERGSVELAPANATATNATRSPEPAVAPPPVPAPAESHKRRTEVVPVPPRAVGWQSHHAAGDYARALAEAERDGFDRLVRQLGAGDLADLADAARLAGDQARARQALLAARARFPQGTHAATAAFLLGRMAADVAADLPAAARWFETSLKEAPQGAYAAEARGRLMTVFERQGDRSRAAALADEYLRRHPTGPYRDVARSLAGAR